MKTTLAGVNLLAMALLGKAKVALSQTWELKGELRPSGVNVTTDPDYGFGWRVALSGNSSLVGSYHSGMNEGGTSYSPGRGSARVFERSDPSTNYDSWEQTDVLVGDDGAGGVYSGYDVALDGDRALMAAIRLSDYIARFFIFEKGMEGWQQVAMLHEDNTYVDDGRVPRVALEGDLAVVGRGFDGNGRAFVYARDGAGVWSESAVLEADDGQFGDYFGADVAISGGDTILVGAAGKAYVFGWNGASWMQDAILLPDLPELTWHQLFGYAVALDGDTAVIGHGNHYGPGVHVFVKGNGTWPLEGKLPPPDEQYHCWGCSVDIEGDVALVGTVQDVAYLYERSDGSWALDQKLQQSQNSYSKWNMGKGVAIEAGTVLAGADRDNWQVGAVNVFDAYSAVPLGPRTIVQYGRSAEVREPVQGSGEGRLQSYWSIGRGHAYEIELFQNDCLTPMDVEITLSKAKRAPLDAWNCDENGGCVVSASFTEDFLEVTYSLNTSAIVSSQAWNEATWKFEVCKVMRLLNDTEYVEVEYSQVFFYEYDPRPSGCLSGEFGDPHVRTFDRLDFDCQAAGEFVMATSLEDPMFQIQERFTAIDSLSNCSQVSVSTGVAIRDTNMPTVQISTPRNNQTSLNMIDTWDENGLTWTQCPVDFYVDGAAKTLDEDLSQYPNLAVSRLGSDRIRVVHLDTYVSAEIRVQYSNTFGCHFFVQTFLPEAYRPGETVVGLLGTCNADRSDDWRASDGAILPVPSTVEEKLFSTAYDYCVDNWCINDEAESIFVHSASGELFGEIRQCDAPYVNEIEGLVTNPPPELAAMCHNGDQVITACVVDGLCGDEIDAQQALDDHWTIELNQQQNNPQPAPTPWPTFPPVAWCVSGEFGDPHIITFDRLGFDCQAAGEFVMVKSLDDPSFQIQERFTAVESSSNCTLASVSTGIVMQDTDMPTVQISTPRTGQTNSLNTINSCPIDIFVDGLPTALGDPIGNNVGVGWWDMGVDINNHNSQVRIQIRVETSATFGCHFLTSVFLPDTFRPAETLLGLLGTCNFDESDDWRTSDGAILPVPTTLEEKLFSTSYNYCVDNWCIHDEADSIFIYGSGESFGDIYQCDVAYANEIEDQVSNPPQALVDICGDSVVCLVDGLCGDESDAIATRMNENMIETTQENINPTPTPPTNSTSSLWDIIYLDLFTDFGASSIDELEIGYDISVDREFETILLQDNCESPIDDIGVVNLTKTTMYPKDEFHQTLVLSYDFNKTALAGSSIWNDATDQIEVCQIVRLIIPAEGPLPKMVIIEDKRVLTISFDLSAGFQIINALEAGSIEEGSGSTNVDSYLEACKCNSVQTFTCDASPLQPNEELIVCIWSVSSDIEVSSLDSMIITQASASLTVVDGDQVQIPAISSMEYVDDANGVAVLTRVPSNIFSFGQGGSLTITGGVVMKFVEDVFVRKLASGEENLEEMSPYELQVDLSGEDASDGDVLLSNAASAVKSFAFLFLVLVSSYPMLC